MEFIEKHKALIITSLLMGIVVLGLYNINMIKKRKENAEIMMELPQELLEEMANMEEEEIIEEDPRDVLASKRTHDAYNEDFENHDDIEQRIKSLTETEASEETQETEEMVEGEEAIAEELNTEEKEELNAEEEPEAITPNNRSSSVTFTLKGRQKKNIPNPIYTCEGNGRVVVQISVNQNGYVIDAKINKKRSTTRNECLFDNALEYARNSLFSSSAVASQKGSITYYFNYSG